MRRFILAAVFAAFFCSSAFAGVCTDYGYTTQTPWLAEGGATPPVNGSVTNPTPFTIGFVGEQASLPYTVPSGYVLILQRLYMEPLWGAVIQPMINGVATETFVSQGIQPATAYKNVGAAQDWQIEYHYPAGANIGLIFSGFNQPGSGYVYGWMMQGVLCH